VSIGSKSTLISSSDVFCSTALLRARGTTSSYNSCPRSTARAALTLAVFLSVPFCCGAQAIKAEIQRQNSVAKDPRAQDLISRALSASGAGWSQVKDFQVTAITSRWDGHDETHKLIISGDSDGKRRFEADPDKNEIRYVEIQNGALNKYSKHNEVPKSTPTQSSLSAPDYFPLPYLYSVLADPQMELRYKGTSKLEDQVVQEVEVTRIFPSKDTSVSFFNHFTTRTLSFDPQTGLLLRISYRAYSNKNATVSLQRSLEYGDYKADHGLLFPHLIKQYQGPVFLDSLSITGLALNIGVPDQLFQNTN